MKQAKIVEQKTNKEIVEEAEAEGIVRKRVEPKLKQEDFAEEGTQLARMVGFVGPDEAQIDGLTCRDAKGFMAKTLHEIYVSVNFPAEPMPTIEHITGSMMISDDPESVELMTGAIEEFTKRQRDAMALEMN